MAVSQRISLIKKLLSNRKIIRKHSCSTNNISKDYDVVIVGGGIVGCASARELLSRHPNLKMALAEKENALARHQTFHNSGVIHAGIYYTPGSLKATLCSQGLYLTKKYCKEKRIPYKDVGKLIVARNDVEVERLMVLHHRGIKNKVPGLQVLDATEIKRYEPNCNGVKALLSPATAITHYATIALQYAKDFEENGGKIHLNFHVNKFEESGTIDYPVAIKAKSGETIRAKYVLTCAGLYSDKVAQLSGCSVDPKILPVRGEYLLLNPKKTNLIKGNIYPVPDPKFPFLGVHFTPRIDGAVWLGPNAVLAFKREGYTWSDINIFEFLESVTYPGFLRLAVRYLVPGVQEVLKSVFMSLQVRDLRKFISDISTADVTRGPAGVRAQALSRSGELVDDFYFDMGTSDLGKRILHCRNAPSPGATSSLAIAKMMSDRMEKEFNIK